MFDLDSASWHTHVRHVLMPHAPSRPMSHNVWTPRPLHVPPAPRTRQMAGLGLALALAISGVIWLGLAALL